VARYDVKKQEPGTGPSVASLLVTGGVVFLRFWTFSGFEDIGVLNGCLVETVISKIIIIIHGVTLGSKLE